LTISSTKQQQQYATVAVLIIHRNVLNMPAVSRMYRLNGTQWSLNVYGSWTNELSNISHHRSVNTINNSTPHDCRNNRD